MDSNVLIGGNWLLEYGSMPGQSAALYMWIGYVCTFSTEYAVGAQCQRCKFSLHPWHDGRNENDDRRI